MNIPKEAIERAIEGGWKVGNRLKMEFWLPGDFAEIALDPSFWQALGKALGWTEFAWQSFAHAFFDTIFAEASTEAFWKALLAPPHQGL